MTSLWAKIQWWLCDLWWTLCVFFFYMSQHSLMGSYGARLVAFGWTSGPQAAPSPARFLVQVQGNPQEPAWGQQLGRGEQGSGLRRILAANCPQQEQIPTCKTSGRGRGRARVINFVCVIEFLFYYFPHKCGTGSFQEKKVNKHKEATRRNCKISIIFPPMLRQCGASQTFRFYWMNLFP